MTKKRKITDAEADNQTFSNLPFDLTSLIMSHLSSEDNIRASFVCKTWHKACVSVRVVEYPIPWLMILTNKEEEYELYDPILAKTYIHNFPELSHSHILYSNDGWLLIRDTNLPKIFFFNPFTHERIQMPWSDEDIISVAFSCAPTSKSCVIFSLSHITIKTYSLATKVCTTFTVPKKLRGGFQHVVFSNGVFYCLTNIGFLGMFDLSTSSWDLLPTRPLKRLRDNKCLMTEYQGDIFLIYLSELDNLKHPTYLKLDLVNRRWTEKKSISLNDFTFYLSFMSTLTTRNDLVMCTQGMPQCNLHNIWIKPPINVSEMFTS